LLELLPRQKRPDESRTSPASNEVKDDYEDRPWSYLSENIRKSLEYPSADRTRYFDNCRGPSDREEHRKSHVKDSLLKWYGRGKRLSRYVTSHDLPGDINCLRRKAKKGSQPSLAVVFKQRNHNHEQVDHRDLDKLDDDSPK